MPRHLIRFYPVAALAVATISLPARADEPSQLPPPAPTTPSAIDQAPTAKPPGDANTIPAEFRATEHDIIPPKHGHRFFDVALDLSRYDYAEAVAPGKSTESGTLPGVYFFFRSQESPRSNYWTLGFEYSPGGTHYDGTTQAPAFTPVQQDTSNAFLRLEGDYGFKLFCLSNELPGCAKFYTGLGIRLWTRGKSQVVDGVASPSEDYSWVYLPFGLRFEKMLTENLSFALDASARWMVAGAITVKFSDLYASVQDASGSLGGKLGGRLELPVQYRISGEIALSFAPWFEYSAIGQGSTFEIIQSGKVVEHGYEPNSRTYQYGSRFGVVYAY
jgi:hypothetical protein